MKKLLSVVLIAVMALSTVFVLISCKDKNGDESGDGGYKAVSGLDTSKDVTIKIATVLETDAALDAVITEFMKKYPNVTVHEEYLNDYDNNAVIALKNNAVDVIFQRDVSYWSNTTTDESTLEETTETSDDYYYNFTNDTEIDFSNTTSKLMNNYMHSRTGDGGETINYMYCVPVGGEVRGMFVNKSLLRAVGKEVPATWSEFLDCCEALSAAGYVPIQGNPSTAGLALSLGDCVNEIVHDQASLEKMRKAEAGVGELFREPLARLYELATKRYYDYNYVSETSGQFKSAKEIDQSRSFLGLTKDPDTQLYSVPENNIGNVGFFPYLSYASNIISGLVYDYNMDTEFAFVTPPLADSADENRAYITPYYGICANKNSKNLIWVREFINFFFQTDMVKTYADKAGIMPNVSNLIEYMADELNIKESACASCGDIFFSETYNGFKPLQTVLTNTIKCSATKKYMVALRRDGSENIEYYTDEKGEYLLTSHPTAPVKIYKEYIGAEDPDNPGYAFCTLQYYIDQLETEFTKYRGLV